MKMFRKFANNQSGIFYVKRTSRAVYLPPFMTSRSLKRSFLPSHPAFCGNVLAWPADLQTAKFRDICVELQYIILQVRLWSYFKRLSLPPLSPSLISEYFQPVVHSFCSHFGDANCDFFGSQKLLQPKQNKIDTFSVLPFKPINHNSSTSIM